jgi:alpha-beta hydrolase superfamily lysophospholipase
VLLVVCAHLMYNHGTDSTGGMGTVIDWKARVQAPHYWRNLALFTAGVLLVGALVAVLGVVYLRTMSIVHPRRLPLTGTPDDVGIANWETVRFPSADGLQLAGWFLPPGPDGDGATLICLHGVRNQREEMLLQAAMLRRHGYGALLFDLRAHGDSEGDTSTLGYAEVADLRGAVDYLLARPDVNPERIGAIGHSMGGAIAIRGAARIPEIRAVVAESAYTSVEDNVADGVRALLRLPPGLFAPLVVWFGERETGLGLRDVRPIDDVSQIAPRAILIVQGGQDPAVPPENGQRLYEAAGEPKDYCLVPEAGHGGYMHVAPEAFEQRIVTFLDTYLRRGE